MGSRWWGRSVIILVLQLSLGGAVAAKETVTQAYGNADKNFKAGNLTAAFSIAAGNLKRFPEHQPSRILVARIYYALGKVKLAAKHFKKIDRDFVAGDFAYEYGISFFSVKDWPRAIQGFKRVSKGSSDAPYARYYLGISYIRLREWQRAEGALARIPGLSPDFEMNRRQILSDLRDVIRRERSGAIIAATPIASMPVAPYYGPPPAVAQPPAGTVKAPAAAPPPKAPIKTGLELTVTPGMSALDKQTSNNYHGYGKDRTSLRKYEATSAVSAKYKFPAFSMGGQPHIGSQVNVAHALSQTVGTGETYIAYADDPQTIVEQVKPTVATSGKTTTGTVIPEIRLPITSFLAGKASYTFTEVYPELDPKRKQTTQGPSGQGELTFDIATVKGTASQLVLTKAGTDFEKTDTSFSGELSHAGEGFNLSLLAQQVDTKVTPAPPEGPVSIPLQTFLGVTTTITATVSRTFEDITVTLLAQNIGYETSDGLWVKLDEDQSTKGELGVTYTIGLGLSLQMQAAMTQLNGYKKYVDAPAQGNLADPPSAKVFAKTNGTAQAISTQFKFAPIDWGYGLVLYKYVTQTFVALDGGLGPAFEKVTPAQTTEFTLQFGVSKAF